MTSEPIEIGSVVRLKAGGPAMTVESHRGTGTHIQCVWFTDGGDVQREEFKAELLAPGKPDKWPRGITP